MASINSIDEIEKFSEPGWWGNHPLYEMLHIMSPTRLQFIEEVLRCHFLEFLESDSSDDAIDNNRLYQGKKMLDIGCGGGVLSLPLRRMGFDVMAIDRNENAIAEANLAGLQTGLDIDFQQITVEDLAQKNPASFDAICCLELLEHLDDVQDFLSHVVTLLKPNGMLFISTMRRDWQSKILAIYMAEYVMRLLPKGTHDWQKFLNPSEIMAYLYPYGCRFYDSASMVFNPIGKSFTLNRHRTAPNYIMAIAKLPNC